MTPEELLIKASEDIAAHGLHKVGYRDWNEPLETAPACAYGALTRVVTNGQTADYAAICGNSNYPQVRQAGYLLALTIDPDVGPLLAHPLPLETDATDTALFTVVTEFNDNPSTSAEDVILMMKRAAHHE